MALSQGVLHGYAIRQAVESDPRSGRVGTSSLYAALTRMAEEGLIESASAPLEGADSRRRYYRITDAGEAVTRAEVLRMAGIVNQARRRALISVADLRLEPSEA
jgi:DNA-binding PadR family transcriptional regulator